MTAPHDSGDLPEPDDLRRRVLACQERTALALQNLEAVRLALDQASDRLKRAEAVLVQSQEEKPTTPARSFEAWSNRSN